MAIINELLLGYYQLPKFLELVVPFIFATIASGWCLSKQENDKNKLGWKVRTFIIVVFYIVCWLGIILMFGNKVDSAKYVIHFYSEKGEEDQTMSKYPLVYLSKIKFTASSPVRFYYNENKQAILDFQNNYDSVLVGYAELGKDKYIATFTRNTLEQNIIFQKASK